jgi:hypothetical protein
VSVHPDLRVHAVVEQGREAEMMQAIDRLRLIHSERRKTVFILCSIPLDIPVDELVTWKQLIGDRRVSDALGECDARGWDALPLAPRQLSRLFPDLWDTEKAAQRWIAKNPPEAYRDIIRVWGVLNSYRPPGQTSWSKALVRHGADRVSPGGDGMPRLSSVLRRLANAGGSRFRPLRLFRPASIRHPAGVGPVCAGGGSR